MTKKRFWLVASGYWLVVIGLFLYSYTQVDLNLTLSQVSWFQTIQKSFQALGWFNRPLSTTIYLFILFLLSTFYFLLLYLVKQKKINNRQFWCLVGITSGILLFSYNAFSYDLFNYLFDARMVTLYHQNPYWHKALDYPLDPWINFMRWTHRTYPYGPVWLFLTVPLSFMGFQLFLPTLFLFKGLATGGFLACVYFIGRIMEKIDPARKLLAMSFFAFNPLVIIESLVSAHNDMIMMAMLLGAFYFLLQRRYLWAWLLFLASIGIKFATGILLPVFLIVWFWQVNKKEIDWMKVYFASFLLMAIAIIIAVVRTELQPWYLLFVLPLVALCLQKKFLAMITAVVSLGLLLHYVPFLYTGNWDPPIPTIKIWITAVSIIVGIAVALTVEIKEQKMIK